MADEADDLLNNLAPADQVESEFLPAPAPAANETFVILGDADTFPDDKTVLIRDSWKIRLVDIRRYELRDKGANVMLFMKDGTSVEVTRAEAALLGI